MNIDPIMREQKQFEYKMDNQLICILIHRHEHYESTQNLNEILVFFSL